MLNNKPFFVALGLSLFLTALFVVGALSKSGITSLDLYLGSAWVFILSMIISLSLPHHLAKHGDKDRNNHVH